MEDRFSWREVRKTTNSTLMQNSDHLYLIDLLFTHFLMVSLFTQLVSLKASTLI